MLWPRPKLLWPDFQLQVHWSLGEMVQQLSNGSQYGRALARFALVRVV